jgi:hypothetical protein
MPQNSRRKRPGPREWTIQGVPEALIIWRESFHADTSLIKIDGIGIIDPVGVHVMVIYLG